MIMHITNNFNSPNFKSLRYQDTPGVHQMLRDLPEKGFPVDKLEELNSLSTRHGKDVTIKFTGQEEDSLHIEALITGPTDTDKNISQSTIIKKGGSLDPFIRRLKTFIII
jgi:hypothetical protein